MDAIEALMRPVPDEERLKALARSLRGRKNAADFFAGSTIPGLQKMAQGEQGYVQDVAERQGVLREAMERRNLDKAQHEASLAQRKEEADAMRQWRADEAEQQRALRLTIAEMGKNGGAGGYNAPKTQKERESFEKGGIAAANLINLAGSYKDEYSPDIPMTGDITNFLGRKAEAFTPDAWTEKAGWWADYKEQAELVRRHALFGSALTRNEQTQWERAMITPNDGPDTIKRKLDVQSQMAAKVAELDAARSLQKNYDPELVMMNYGDVVDVPALAAKVADGSYFSELEARQKSARESEPQEESSDSEELQEGDVIENEAGERLVLRNGEWVPE